MYKFPTCTPQANLHQPTKKNTLPRSAKPRMYKFPTCTPQANIHQSTKKNSVHQPDKPRMYKFPTCTPVCTSFRLVHRKANFTNQKKQTFPDQLNLVCTSFRLVLPYVQVSDLYSNRQTSPTKKTNQS